MTTQEELLEALAAGLRSRVLERRRAAERLADFAFTEGAPATGRGSSDGPTDWRYFVTRSLAVAGDPATIELLERLADGDRPLSELTGPGDARTGDRLAVIDWIGGLAAAGLVGHELATDRVALTQLGRALLELIQEWEARAAVDGPVARTDAAVGGGTAR